MFVSKAGDYTKWCAPGLTHKHLTRLERLATGKPSCSLQTLVNCSRKKFYNVGSRATSIPETRTTERKTIRPRKAGSTSRKGSTRRTTANASVRSLRGTTTGTGGERGRPTRPEETLTLNSGSVTVTSIWCQCCKKFSLLLTIRA